MLDVSVKLIRYVAGLLRKERKALGTRKNTRALTCWYQAVFAIAWFRDQPEIARHGKAFGISQATAYRYLGEVINVLADQAPRPARGPAASPRGRHPAPDPSPQGLRQP